MAKKQSFTEKLQRLEEIRSLLDIGEMPIEKSLDIYEEGIALAHDLQSFLHSAEQRIITITEKYNTRDQTS